MFMFNLVKLKFKGLVLLFPGIILFHAAIAQMSISGPTCVLAGTQYTYTIAGNWTSSTNMVWSLTGSGTFSGSTSGTPLPQVHVTWNSGTTGTLKVTTTNPSSSPSITITIAAVLAAGTISNPSQNINTNTIPTALSCSPATGGYCTPSYTYQWQQSTDNVTYTNITGATSLNLTFTVGLTQTMYYRRMVTETNSNTVGYSNVATILVYPPIVPGTISPNTPTINYYTTATLSITGVSGGNGTYSYQWQFSGDGINFQNILNATAVSYTTPAQIFTSYYKVIVTSNALIANSGIATVNVNPPLSTGVVTPSLMNIASGTSPGLISANPASGGGCNGSYSYQWQSSTNSTVFSNISGATGLNYTPGTLTANTWYRRQVTCGSDIEYTNAGEVTVGAAAPNLNLIRVRDILKPGVPDTTTAGGLTSTSDVHQVSQYFDGLGKLIQTVSMQASPLQKDVVSFNVYDNFEREVEKYLPYVASTTDGNYKTTFLQDQASFNTTQYAGESNFYSETNFESSPLNRVFNGYPQGINWVGSTRGATNQYLLNNVSDSVCIWTISSTQGSIPTTASYYAPGQLFKNVSIDEQNHQVVQYTDKEGQVILKKVQLSATPGTAHAGWLNTYYVYDDLNNLRFVIQPQAVVLINSNWSISTGIANELCFRYEYDQRKRMVIKKIPGAGELWMVYDSRDRVVMTQDNNLRVLGKWMVSKYDSLNRVDTTGLLTDANNQTYHQNLAYYSVNYPSTISNFEILSSTFYDDYAWVSRTGASVGASMATNYTSNSSYFNTAYNTSPTYAVSVTPLYITRGLVTGTMTKVIGTTSQYLYASSFYDDRGRVIQSQAINFTGAIDTITTQFNFTGKPIRSLLSHKKNGNTVQAHMVLTKMDYDQGLRLKHIWKNIDGAGSDQLIDSIQYDELGQLRAKYLGNNVDSLVYDYNIRGWLTGINKNYVGGTTTHYFGMELGYEKQASIIGTTTYAAQQFNGNITGTVWKSAGDGVGRKYDFTYDDVNRLTAANFVQNTSGTSWDFGYIDFTTSNLTYDANGNIMSMNQKGFKVGGSQLIDQLTYTYQTNSNKLSQVNDASNDPLSKLGDFHYTGSKGSSDYTYDGNGNLISDNNKLIDNITYNYLNLPSLVHPNTKGNIVYVYDAGGNKLEKITSDSASRHTTTTLYIAGFVYQQSDTISNPTGGIDTLQFIAQEEGRVRWAYHKYTTGYSAYGFEYDFFEKDHLGNTRMVLTQQKDTAKYLASGEAAYRATESQLFANLTTTTIARTAAPGYPVDLTITNPNDTVFKVNGNVGGHKMGPSLLLKVMSGDKIDIAVESFYNTGTTNTPNSSITDVLASLATGVVNMTSGGKGSITDLNNTSSSPIYAALNSFLPTDDPTPSGKPKAYLNWILLDDQLKYVSSYPQSGAVVVGAAGTLNTIGYTGLPITKNGFLYIWVSNETPNWDAFFDNLVVCRE